MIIKNIQLENYRNYENMYLELGENVNIILGKNGHGKTNILEAINLCAFGKSFRTTREQEVIKFEKEFCKVQITSHDNIEEKKISIIIKKHNNKVINVNKKILKKTSQLINSIIIVTFTPEDLKIVKEDPENRRRYIDKELCVLYPSYMDTLIKYKKVLLQRNAYLKEEKIDMCLLDVLDIELAKYGTSIMYKRKELLEKISEISKEIHGNITNNKEELNIKYDNNIEFKKTVDETETAFSEMIKENRRKDIQRRYTTLGPHKDDIEFFINGKNVKMYGSQGQQRTTALSLKLSEIEIIKREKEENPIILLDDVLSELDEERKKYLIKSFEELQILITTTEIENEILKNINKKKIINVENGKIST